ncbi:transmembrane protein, putative [Rhizoctonia solani AG-3 Rhs1AP]|uniref:Transmembrane protein, putative n=1 Tax=Rhizoctonia solani AG-3 Rhs1AP TaxID=1086054 RepID=X8IYI8_9AGAM|nr:transmembrane protein, putative [Rhizoctonia solani AG-3 Rhs1AP]
MARAPEAIFYPTYTPPYTPYQVDTGSTVDSEVKRIDSQRAADNQSERRSIPRLITAVVRGPWWMLGFEKWWSLGLFVLCGGGAIAFCLAGAQKMSFQRLIATTTPVEGYWYQRSPWKVFIMLHILTIIPATFFSVFCFLPISFKMWPRVHGAVGYIVSFLLVVGCVGGGVAARRAQGGELGVQLGYYMLSLGSAASVIIGCIEGWRGAFDAHREWMLRAWIYNGALVTAHAAGAISAQMITFISNYYTPMRCSEIRYLVSSDIVSSDFPLCSTPEAILNPDSQYLAVKAAWDEGKLGQSSAIRATFGMSMLLAIFLHCVGVEIYMRATRDESRKLQDWSRKSRLRVTEPSGRPYLIP